MDKKSQVTKIEKQGKRVRFNIWINDSFSFSVSAETALQYGLAKGMILTEANIREIQSVDQVDKVFNRALLILSFRMHSEEELRRKLKKFESSAVEEAIVKLKDLDLINDEVFIEKFIAYSQKGQKLIRLELFKKGIKKEQIDSFLRGVEIQTEIEKAKKYIVKMKPMLDGLSEPEVLNILYRKLGAKGFSYDVAKTAKKEIDEGI